MGWGYLGLKRLVRILLTACVALCAAGFLPARADDSVEWSVPSVDRLPDSPWGRIVRQGRDVILNTPALIGPAAPNPANRYAGNTLSCGNCHLGAGTKPFGLPLVGVFADFPQYSARDGRVGTLEDRINGCMRRSMNGRPLPLDDPAMRAMVAYIKFLSEGATIGKATFGRGAGAMPLLDRAADPIRGAQVYARTCAACHGANGMGLRADGRTVFPPLWGNDSFNDGAGMDRLIAAANFIHSNMPNGATWDEPVLSVEDSWDVAAYVQSQPRPQMAGLQKDYPILSQKPVDTGYGPYADGFDQTQHRLGPFGPMLVRH